MLMTRLPQMLVSESAGWEEVDRTHHSAGWFRRMLAMPMSLLPPAMYAYAEIAHPGAIFPLQVPAPTPAQLVVVGVVMFAAQMAMVAYLAMLIQRMVLSRDHDPGADAAYALATIALVPLWLSSLALFVPSTWFAITGFSAGGVAAAVLVRHGVHPLLHVDDERKAHYIADVVTLTGMAAWIAMIVVCGFVLSMLLSWHVF